MGTFTTYAEHSYAPGTTNTMGGRLWDTQRYFNAGTVGIDPIDYKVTASDATGQWFTKTFNWVDVEFRVYKRAGANSAYLLFKTIRRVWGGQYGFISLGSVPAGTYSLYTRPVAINDAYGTRAFDAATFSGARWALRADFACSHA